MNSILVTGASSGFGRQTAIELARRGWRVFATMRDLTKWSPVEDAIPTLSGRLHLVEMDVTNAASIEGAMTLVLETTGGTLDVLLNNAGYTSMGFFEDMSDADCRSVMETNFFGAVAVARAVIPVMRSAGHGRIGFVSSNAVNSPHPTMAMYASSKWALEGFAEALAMELAPFGVDVTVLQPGNHRTPFASHVRVIKPSNSAYARLWDALMPGLAELEATGCDPSTATPIFVQALIEPRPQFLWPIGTDVKLFSWLKRHTSYEVRASLIRRFVGFPGRSRHKRLPRDNRFSAT